VTAPPVLAPLVERWRSERLAAEGEALRDRLRDLFAARRFDAYLLEVERSAVIDAEGTDRALGYLVDHLSPDDLRSAVARLAPRLGRRALPHQIRAARDDAEREALLSRLVDGFPAPDDDIGEISVLLSDSNDPALLDRFLAVTEPDPRLRRQVSARLRNRAVWLGTTIVPKSAWVSPRRSVFEVLTPGATRTCLVFAGLGRPAASATLRSLKHPESGLPLVETLGMNVLYLGDDRHSLFLRGVRTLGDTLADTFVALRERLAALGTTELVCCGGSAGGFAAMRYGMGLRAGAVLAFSPPTDMSPTSSAIDTRATRMRDGVMRGLPLEATRLVDRIPTDAPDTRFELYYGARSPIDAYHAAQVGSLPNVSLTALDTDEHETLQWLAKQGAAVEIVSRFFAAPVAPWTA
jgi:hypothetical protein